MSRGRREREKGRKEGMMVLECKRVRARKGGWKEGVSECVCEGRDEGREGEMII